jgi:hypothetical protein
LRVAEKPEKKRETENAFGNASNLIVRGSIVVCEDKDRLGETKVFASLSHGSVHLMSQLLISLVFRKIQFCTSALALILHTYFRMRKTYG